MDALILTGGLALAIPGMVGGMCWVDPKGAEWLAAKMRGRAVQLRMMKVAREKARAAAAEVYQQCREGWDEEDREAMKEGRRELTQEVVNG